MGHPGCKVRFSLTRLEEDDGLEAAALGAVRRELPEAPHDLHHRLDLHVRDLVLGRRRDRRLPRGDDLRMHVRRAFPELSLLLLVHFVSTFWFEL